MLNLVNEETATNLKNSLSRAAKLLFFKYQNKFNQDEKIHTDKETFIKDIMTKFHEDNNQLVPFQKIEDGYVQCIPDP